MHLQAGPGAVVVAAPRAPPEVELCPAADFAFGVLHFSSGRDFNIAMRTHAEALALGQAHPLVKGNPALPHVRSVDTAVQEVLGVPA